MWYKGWEKKKKRLPFPFVLARLRRREWHNCSAGEEGGKASKAWMWSAAVGRWAHSPKKGRKRRRDCCCCVALLVWPPPVASSVHPSGEGEWLWRGWL